MSRHIAGVIVCLLTTSAVASACGGRQRHTPDETVLPPAPVRPASLIDYDFMWRQEVTADWGERSQSFEAVLQKVGSQLSLVGLSPAGRPGFQLVQENNSISFENLSNREFPFEPAYILADIQCAFFPWVTNPPHDGQAQVSIDGFNLVEVRSAGLPITRTFTRDDAQDAGTLVVNYVWRADSAANEPGDAPFQVSIVSEWYGYTLIIRTLEQTRL